jgi:hypothetical protein
MWCIVHVPFRARFLLQGHDRIKARLVADNARDMALARQVFGE